MTPLFHFLEAFYIREQARGVALLSPSTDISFGRSATSCLSMIESTDGFVQLHLEHSWVSVYSSKLGRATFLIVQYPFQEEYPPPLRPWLAFVQLSSAVYRGEYGGTSDPPIAGVPVLRPSPGFPSSGASSALENNKEPDSRSQFIANTDKARWPRSNSA